MPWTKHLQIVLDYCQHEITTRQLKLKQSRPSDQLIHSIGYLIDQTRSSPLGVCDSSSNFSPDIAIVELVLQLFAAVVLHLIQARINQEPSSITSKPTSSSNSNLSLVFHDELLHEQQFTYPKYASKFGPFRVFQQSPIVLIERKCNTSATFCPRAEQFYPQSRAIGR